MLRSALSALACALPAPVAEAHCDGPCGVYDPASARVAAEAVLSMTKKLKAMEAPAAGDAAALAAYNNTFGRYVAIKEEEAQKTKKELLILWTDYFKPDHPASPEGEAEGGAPVVAGIELLSVLQGAAVVHHHRLAGGGLFAVANL